MIKKELSFKLKGDRDYVQGPDICESILKTVEEAGLNARNIVISLHRFTNRNLILEIGENNEFLKNDKIKCSLKFEDAGTIYYGIAYEADTITQERVDYPEQLIIKQSKISGTQIYYHDKGLRNFGILEKLVSLNKHLSSSIFQSESGKWIFTKLELTNTTVKAEYDRIAITLIKNIGVRMTKSKVEIDGRLIGYIYFSMI